MHILISYFGEQSLLLKRNKECVSLLYFYVVQIKISLQELVCKASHNPLSD